MQIKRGAGFFLVLWMATTVFFGQSGGTATDDEAHSGVSVRFRQNLRDPKLKIDAVPQEYRPGFRLFQSKCAECHTLRRTLQKSNLSKDEWSDIVFRMQDMASSHMETAQSESITKYLVWNDAFQQKAGKP